ncbi:MAG: hypothetical protein AAF492_23915, partial [Verrucomicrobiota bacterium]
MLAAAFFTGLLWSCAVPPPEDENADARFPFKRCIISCVLLGLLCLTDYYMAFAGLIPIFLFWTRWAAWAGLNQRLQFRGSIKKGGGFNAWLSQRTAPKVAALVLLVVLLVTLPWMIRNMIWTGDPFYSLQRFEIITHTKSNPGLSVLRIYEQPGVSAAGLAFAHFGEVLNKGMTGLGDAARAWAAQANILVLALFILSFLSPAESLNRRLHVYLLFVMLLYSFKVAFYSQDLDRLAIMIPALLALGVGSALQRKATDTPEETSEKKRRRKGSNLKRLFASMIRNQARALTLVLIVFSLFMLVAAKLDYRKPGSLLPTLNVDYLEENTEEGDVVLTASPWLFVWYAEGRTALWMPETKTSFDTIDERFGEKIDWLYFPRQRANLPPDDIPGLWMNIVKEPTGYGNYRGHPSQSIDERLFKRKEQ